MSIEFMLVIISIHRFLAGQYLQIRPFNIFVAHHHMVTLFHRCSYYIFLHYHDETIPLFRSILINLNIYL